ncbi:MAG: MFS transporter [Planctomycetes bacterium]|nr:MFS transporter [Planctomycetota bacterium]
MTGATWDLLKTNGDFRRLFAARLTSLFGDWLTLLAVVESLRRMQGGGGALAFAYVLVLKTLPTLLIAPWAGVIVDRVSRKGLLVATDLARAAIVLGLFVACQGDHPGVLYALVFAQTVCQGIAEPARNAVVPDVVAAEHLSAANALNAAAWSLMFTAGTLAGGPIAAWVGPGAAFGIDALTYGLSAALVLGVAIPALPAREAEPRTLSGLLGLKPMLEGFRYLLQRPRLLTLALAKPGWSLAGATTLLLTLLGEDFGARWGRDDKVFLVALLWCARGVGTGVGPLLARHLARDEPRRMERLIGLSYLWGAGFYLLLGQVSGFALSLLCVALAHLGGSTVWVLSTIRLQAETPTEVRGRVFASEQGAWTLLMASSTFGFAVWIDHFGGQLPHALSLVGLLLLIPAGLWALRMRWTPAEVAAE